MKKIAEYDLQYTGIEHSQYHRGAGVSFTRWDEVYLGNGMTPNETFEDALEQAAICDWDVEKVKKPVSIQHPAIMDTTLCEMNKCEFRNSKCESAPACNSCEMYCWAELYIKGK